MVCKHCPGQAQGQQVLLPPRGEHRQQDSAQFYCLGLLSCCTPKYESCKYTFSNFLALAHISKSGPATQGEAQSPHTPNLQINPAAAALTGTYLHSLPSRVHTQTLPSARGCANTATHTHKENHSFPTAGISVAAAAALPGTATAKQKRKSLLGTRICGTKERERNLGSERSERKEAEGCQSLISELEEEGN